MGQGGVEERSSSISPTHERSRRAATHSKSGSLRRPRACCVHRRTTGRCAANSTESPASRPIRRPRQTSESADIPFGSAHTYRAGLTASYMVFSGGRSLAQTRAAASGRRAAELGVVTPRAHRFGSTSREAYYDAMLADHLHRIAEWTLEQAESTYRRVALVSRRRSRAGIRSRSREGGAGSASGRSSFDARPSAISRCCGCVSCCMCRPTAELDASERHCRGTAAGAR